MPLRSARWAVLAATAVLAACATPRPAGAPAGAVSVSWNDPAGFSGTRAGERETVAEREAWLSELGRHLAEKAATVLPGNEQLEVQITDMQRAGSFEPWRGPRADNVRIVRDVYPPRIALEFRRLAEDGRVLQSGQRTLRDPNFLMRTQRYPNDPLAYEKQLLDDWVGVEFSRQARR